MAYDHPMRGARKSDRRSQCRVHRERTAWLGWKDSNSEMSMEIISFGKIAQICGNSAEFWLWS
jgi:hypothetical protein